MREGLTFGSLFAGIGGLDLGLERAGMQCAWQVEIDDYATRVLTKHWPGVPKFRDVREVGAHNLSPVDLICGGFPCQDISYAGKGAGLAGARSGLWYEFARIVRELRPNYVLVENVAALLTRGLDAVLGTLASLGYDAEWDCISAASVGAPHIRERIFLVAYPCGLRAEPWGEARHLAGADRTTEREAQERQWRGDAAVNRSADVANTNGEWELQPEGLEQDERGWTGNGGSQVPNTDGAGLSERHERGSRCAAASRVSARCESERAHSADRWEQWNVEPDVGRVAHGVPARVDRLRGLGNAVVPQVAEYVGRSIVDHHTRSAA